MAALFVLMKEEKKDPFTRQQEYYIMDPDVVYLRPAASQWQRNALHRHAHRRSVHNKKKPPKKEVTFFRSYLANAYRGPTGTTTLLYNHRQSVA
jgi:hypothetical protein